MSSSTGDGKKMLKLKSSDSQIFQVEEEIATRSLLIKRCLGDDTEILADDDTEIPIPNVDGKTLSKVIEWCRKHSGGGEDSIGISKKEYEDWKSKFMDVDIIHELYDIMNASNYLEVEDLLECCLSKTADLMTGKTPEEVRKILGINNDFSKEEEEENKKNNWWALNNC